MAFFDAMAKFGYVQLEMEKKHKILDIAKFLLPDITSTKNSVETSAHHHIVFWKCVNPKTIYRIIFIYLFVYQRQKDHTASYTVGNNTYIMTCSIQKHNRPIKMGNGDFRTPEPMEIKFGDIHCVGQKTHAKIGLRLAGVWARRSGEVFRSRVLFRFLCHVYREDCTTHRDFYYRYTKTRVSRVCRFLMYFVPTVNRPPAIGEKPLLGWSLKLKSIQRAFSRISPQRLKIETSNFVCL